MPKNTRNQNETDRNQQWLSAWQAEADRLFRDLESVPRYLRDDLLKLREYQRESRRLTEEIQALRDRYDQKRRERQAAEARMDAIVARQRQAVEQELLAQELARWNRKIRWLRAEVDRVTNKVLLGMRRRQLEAEREKEQAAQQQRRQATHDLAVWETFKQQLTRYGDPQAIDVEAVNRSVQNPEEVERLQQEYADFQRRMGATDAENDAAWARFVQSVDDTPKPPEPDPPPAPKPKKKRSEAKRLRQEYEAYQQQSGATDAENQAVWEDFTQNIDDHLDLFDDWG